MTRSGEPASPSEHMSSPPAAIAMLQHLSEVLSKLLSLAAALTPSFVALVHYKTSCLERFAASITHTLDSFSQSAQVIMHRGMPVVVFSTSVELNLLSMFLLLSLNGCLALHSVRVVRNTFFEHRLPKTSVQIFSPSVKIPCNIGTAAGYSRIRALIISPDVH